MAGKASTAFLEGKVVADFGCGPRGSLCWATCARERIGIDVLANAYQRFGVAKHNMQYVQCSEREISLPSKCVEILFTVCAMHYCHDFEAMSGELLRILAPGASFIASFNLDEPPCALAPRTLTEEMVHENILRHLEVDTKRIAPAGPKEDAYRYLIDPTVTRTPHPIRYMWITARKPGELPTERPLCTNAERSVLHDATLGRLKCES